jgi:putative spermidine/putrescine transport system substrate-binding protein
MKRYSSLILIFTLLLGVLLTGCSEKTSSSKGKGVTTIHFYSVAGGDEYYKDILIPMFEKEMKGKYKVEYGRGTAQEIINKIKSQGKNGNIDIIATGIDGLPMGIKENLWEQLIPKYKKETHVDDLNEIAQSYVEAFDGYGVPNEVVPGGPVLVYNKDKVKQPPKNFKELQSWIDQNPNKFLYAALANSGPARGFFFGVAQSFGEDFANGANLDKTWDYLEKINKNIDVYPSKSSETFNLLFDGTVDIVPHLPLWYAYMKSLGQIPENIGIVKMEDSKQVIDAQFYVMLKDLPEERKKAALKFIDFAMSEKVQAQGYPVGRIPTNKKATSDLVLPEYKDDYDKLLKALMPEFKDGNNAIVPDGDWVLFPDTDTMNKYYKKWEEKIQSKK